MIHINNFVDKIKFFESKNNKDFIMSMREAKDLHADITKLLLVLQTLQEKNSSSINDKNINVELRGDTW
jgi:hypothetical protein